jgi:prepilin-type processing-associated H-X9-DG protein
MSMQYRLSTIFLVFFVVAVSLAAFGVWGLLVGGLALVIAFLFYLEFGEKITDVVFVIVITVIVFLIGLASLALQGTREIDLPPTCANNMKQLGLALHNYHDAYKHFPAIIARDKNGNPLYSWLVTILPHMEYDTIYNQVNKDEPWDSPHNAQILGQLRICEFDCPSAGKEAKDFSASYVAIIGPGTIRRSDGPVSIKDLPNGSSRSVMAVECINSDKHWAEPYILTAEEVLERMKTGKGMRICTAHHNYINVLFADGGVRGLQTDMPISLWRKLLMGEIESLGELDNWKASPADPPPKNLWINQPPPPPGKWQFLLSILVWLVSLALLFRRAWKSGRMIAAAQQNAEEGAGSGKP